MKTPMILLALAFPFSVLAADVSGTWKSEFDSQIGVQKYTFTFKQDGTNLTGKASSDAFGRNHEAELKEGRINGEAISFVELLTIQDNEVRITYTGKLSTNANEINFTREVGDIAKEEIVAKRESQESAPAAMPATAATSVDGGWQAQFDTQRGLQKYTFTFKQDGTNLTGKASVEMEDQKRDVEFKDGTVEGGQLSFHEPLNVQGNDINITFTGKLSAKGDEIAFHRQVGDFGSSDATAKRTPAPAPAPSAATPPPSSTPSTPAK